MPTDTSISLGIFFLTEISNSKRYVPIPTLALIQSLKSVEIKVPVFLHHHHHHHQRQLMNSHRTSFHFLLLILCWGKLVINNCNNNSINISRHSNINISCTVNDMGVGNIFPFYLGDEMTLQFDWFDIIIIILLLFMGIKVVIMVV